MSSESISDQLLSILRKQMIIDEGGDKNQSALSATIKICQKVGTELFSQVLNKRTVTTATEEEVDAMIAKLVSCCLLNCVYPYTTKKQELAELINSSYRDIQDFAFDLGLFQLLDSDSVVVNVFNYFSSFCYELF